MKLFSIQNDNLVKTIKKKDSRISFSSWLLNYDKESDGIFLTSGDLRQMNMSDIETLVKGLTNYLCHYSDADVREYNDKIRAINDSNDQEDRHKFKEAVDHEFQEFIKKYDAPGSGITQELLDKFLSPTVRIMKNDIVLSDIPYPAIVLLYQKQELIYIGRVIKDITGYMARQLEVKDFDTYSVIPVNEKYFEDVYSEGIVRYHPSKNFHSVLSVKNTLYRSINQIKKRYKKDRHIDLRVIKKVIQIYDVPVHYLPNSQMLVNRQRFDEGLEKYFTGRGR